MKRIIPVLATVLAFFVCSCSELDSLKVDVNKINSKITEITSTISKMEDVEEQLKQYITELAVQITDINVRIEEYAEKHTAEYDDLLKQLAQLKEQYEALVAEDDRLQEQIDALKDNLTEMKEYVDDQITDLKAWANERYATLDMYKEIESQIQDIVSQLEVIDDIYARIEKLTNDRTEMLNKCEELVKSSIKDLAGTVEEVMKNLEEEIKELDRRITELENDYVTYEKRLEAAEKKLDSLFRTVRSIVLIPECSDGGIQLGSAPKYSSATEINNRTLRVIVTPASMADVIRNYWLHVKKSMSIEKISSGSVTTCTARITARQNKDDEHQEGEIKLKVTFKFAGKVQSGDQWCASIHLATGYTDVATSYFPLNMD